MYCTLYIEYVQLTCTLDYDDVYHDDDDVYHDEDDDWWLVRSKFSVILRK
jgi:hypothetical protein